MKPARNFKGGGRPWRQSRLSGLGAMTLIQREAASAETVPRRTQLPRAPKRRSTRGRVRRWVAMTSALAIPIALVTQIAGVPATNAAIVNPGPVGNGFTVTPGDLAFILKQIKIAERHSTTLDPTHPCSTLLNQPGDGIPDAEQVPDILTSYGLRTVDGSCNNLKLGDENFAACDQPFPRLTPPRFRDADSVPTGFGPPGPSSYKQKKGNVFDSQPRVISNLIVDQTSTNPAAVAAAGNPVRTQGNPGVVPCQTPPAVDPVTGDPVPCTADHQTLFIPNV